jgi:excisionase family DNA binding protein
MSTSPALRSDDSDHPPDVMDRLHRCGHLWTAKEPAQILAISPKTIYAYVARNLIPRYKVESNVRFRARDIAEWLRRTAHSRLRSFPEDDPHASRRLCLLPLGHP